ncbi:MAG: translation elongation factor Ts [Gammaproteobacteria bacterium]|nr:translation elongation factor Ts [Gammaproteobacteria bacterium]MDC3098782.1 translation elongation factor Ts [Gammaproteobacteria bacterium]|tara:strand:+ start:62 stop:850 length:789 start_codon:yes stop_codon:yes gene_type:complete
MVTAQLVKELRERTGISMMDCKSALTESGGDIEKAIEVLRKKSVLKAEKKSGRATNEGAVVIGSSDDISFIIEVDTETDFAAKDASFQKFLEDLTIYCTKHSPSDLDDLNEKYNAQLLEIIQKIGENIKISYFEKLSIDGAVLASYKHSDNRLAAIVKLDSGDESLGRDIAMQVAANNPMAIYPDDIDQEILEKEKEIALATLANENKPEEIIEKIIIGKLNKFKMENALVEQPFIKDPDKKIKDLLGTSKIISFLRKKVGE